MKTTGPVSPGGRGCIFNDLYNLETMPNKDFRRWFIQSVTGLLLTGAGLCLAIDAGFQRASGGTWVAYGTFSLAVFQAGLCLMIDSIRFRIRSDR
jgi:hypothetical protein